MNESGPEHVYMGKIDIVTVPIYDANKRKIDVERTRFINAQSNRLGPSLESGFLKFSNLCELNLSDNSLQDEHLEKFTVSPSLRSLDLSNNKLITVPLEPGRGFKRLEKLILQGNAKLNIGACVNYLVGLRRLKHLDFSRTEIDTISEEIRKIQTIEYLNISDTNIDERNLPFGVFSLGRLKHLVTSVEHGDYSGPVLEEFLKGQILKRLKIQPTDGVLTWKYSRGHVVDVLKQVKEMELNNEWPSGPVDKLWLNTSKLGDISEENLNRLFQYLCLIRSFKHITLMSLCTNNFYEIPTLRYFDSLTQLGICRNNLTSIPSHVLSLPHLTHLYITENRIRELSFKAVDLPSIELIDLDDNPLCYRYDEARRCTESAQKNLPRSCTLKGLDAVLTNGDDLEYESDNEDATEEATDAIMSPPHYLPMAEWQYGPQKPRPELSGAPQGYLPGDTRTNYIQSSPRYAPPVQALKMTPVELEKVRAVDISDLDETTTENLRKSIEVEKLVWGSLADRLSFNREAKKLLEHDGTRHGNSITSLLLDKMMECLWKVGDLYDRLMELKRFKPATVLLQDVLVQLKRNEGELGANPQEPYAEKHPTAAYQHPTSTNYQYPPTTNYRFPTPAPGGDAVYTDQTPPQLITYEHRHQHNHTWQHGDPLNHTWQHGDPHNHTGQNGDPHNHTWQHGEPHNHMGQNGHQYNQVWQDGQRDARVTFQQMGPDQRVLDQGLRYTHAATARPDPRVAPAQEFPHAYHGQQHPHVPLGNLSQNVSRGAQNATPQGQPRVAGSLPYMAPGGDVIYTNPPTSVVEPWGPVNTTPNCPDPYPSPPPPYSALVDVHISSAGQQSAQNMAHRRSSQITAPSQIHSNEKAMESIGLTSVMFEQPYWGIPSREATLPMFAPVLDQGRPRIPACGPAPSVRPGMTRSVQPVAQPVVQPVAQPIRTNGTVGAPRAPMSVSRTDPDTMSVAPGFAQQILVYEVTDDFYGTNDSVQVRRDSAPESIESLYGASGEHRPSNAQTGSYTSAARGPPLPSPPSHTATVTSVSVADDRRGSDFNTSDMSLDAMSPLSRRPPTQPLSVTDNGQPIDSVDNDPYLVEPCALTEPS